MTHPMSEPWSIWHPKMDDAHEGWKEATIAWAVCASLHREYCKGKDPFFKTRQADFIKHENEARAKYLALEPR